MAIGKIKRGHLKLQPGCLDVRKFLQWLEIPHSIFKFMGKFRVGWFLIFSTELSFLVISSDAWIKQTVCQTDGWHGKRRAERRTGVRVAMAQVMAQLDIKWSGWASQRRTSLNKYLKWIKVSATQNLNKSQMSTGLSSNVHPISLIPLLLRSPCCWAGGLCQRPLEAHASWAGYLVP